LKTAVMTGATGFLGGALLRELIAEDWFVYALCRRDSRRRHRLEGLDRIEIIETDLSSATVDTRITGCDAFFHLAWEGGRNSFDEQFENVGITLNCLRLAEKLGAKTFLCTGSQAEYGETREMITEETAVNPCTSYGAAKAAAYFLARDYAKQTNVSLLWTRVFSVYGEHDNPNSLIPCLCKSLRKTGSAQLTTDGTQMWNYLHETDAARALRLLVESGVEGVFNVASMESRPLREYVGMISDRISFGTEKSDVNLNVSVDKLHAVIGEWEKRQFEIAI